MVSNERVPQRSFFEPNTLSNGFQLPAVQEELIRVYHLRPDPCYGPAVSFPSPMRPVPRTRVLDEQGKFMIVARGKKREVVVFEKREKGIEYRHRSKHIDDPRGVIKDFWCLNEGITLLPNKVEEMSVLEGGQLERVGVGEIGGKAYGLSWLKSRESLGFKVPEFFVIPTSFYRRLKHYSSFESRAEEFMVIHTPDEMMRANISHSPRMIPPEIHWLFQKLHYFDNFHPLFWEKMIKLGQWDQWPPSKALYFRSSSPLEDGKKDPFPGVFASRLVRFASDCRDAIDEILLSSWTPYAEHHLRSRGLAGRVSRDMAVIIQEVPNDIRFTGRVFREGDNLEIEYVGGLTLDGNYMGTKAVVDRDLNITEIVRGDRQYLTYSSNQEETIIPEAEIKRLAKLVVQVEKEFGDEINLEFALGEDFIYMLQIRPTVRHKEKAVINFEDIKPENIIARVEVRFTGFSMGRVEGRAVNLLDVDSRTFNQESAQSLDQQYPGAIYLVSHYQKPSPKAKERVSYFQIMNEETHLLTPRKKGVVICSHPEPVLGGFHDHFTEELKNDPCFFIFAPVEAVEEIPTSTPIGIASDGKRAVIYKCEGEPRDDGRSRSVTEKQKEKRYYNRNEIEQVRLFDS